MPFVALGARAAKPARMGARWAGDEIPARGINQSTTARMDQRAGGVSARTPPATPWVPGKGTPAAVEELQRTTHTDLDPATCEMRRLHWRPQHEHTAWSTDGKSAAKTLQGRYANEPREPSSHATPLVEPASMKSWQDT